MRRTAFFVLMATALSLGAAGSAFGADLGLGPIYKAPPPPPPAPIYGWTGFYVGLNAGYGWGQAEIDNSVISTFCNPVYPGCLNNSYSNAAAAAVPRHFTTNPSGFIGGGQIGYNLQTGQVVWGVEADFQGANIKGNDSQTFSVVPAGPVPAGTVTVAGTGSQKLDWFGTVRARMGWTPINPLLVYATGGLAYGHVTANTSFSETIAGGGIPFGPFPTVTASESTTRFGWVLGGGMEWMLTPQWTIKGEYLYYDLGSVTLASPPLIVTSGGNETITSVGIQSQAHFKGNIARIGVNYKF